MMSASTTPLLSSSAGTLPNYQATFIPIDFDAQPQETGENGAAEEPMLTHATDSGGNDANGMQHALNMLIDNTRELIMVRQELRSFKDADAERAYDIRAQARKISSQSIKTALAGYVTILFSSIFAITAQAKEWDKDHKLLTNSIFFTSSAIGVLLVCVSMHLSILAASTQKLATRISQPNSIA